jgi:Carboxypeptidase regulatory-like domain
MGMRRRTQYIVSAILAPVLGVLIFGNVGNAEDTHSETGRVRGSVTTTLRHGLSYGLAGANLKLKREAEITETSANDAGDYEFTNLSPGKYMLEASLEGFESSSETIIVRAGKTLVENVKLELANQTASVPVTSTAQRPATTETATISTE